MNYKILTTLLFFTFSCSTYHVEDKEDKKDIIIGEPFTNKGFALLFETSLKKNKKISKSLDERSLNIFQKNLKKNANVKITNLINNKSIIATVSSKSKYPLFYNSVISKRIFDELQIDPNEPYVELVEINENSIFFAKKAKTYDEEKNVADKAPVDGISIKNLNTNSENKIINNKKNTFKYIIKVADFYFNDTANLMVQRINEETKINKVNIKNISNTNYRVYIGPYKDLNSLKKAFYDINKLNFENIEIIKQ